MERAKVLLEAKINLTWYTSINDDNSDEDACNVSSENSVNFLLDTRSDIKDKRRPQ